MSLTDDFYDNLTDFELINGTIQQLVEDINYNLSGRIIGNSNLFFIELLNSDEIDPDDDPENVSLLITLIANNQGNGLSQQIEMDLGNSLGLMITNVVRFDGCPTSSTTLLSDSGDPKLTLTIKWPETNIGEIAVVNCPCGSNGTSASGTLNASRNCGGDFSIGALWQAPFVMKCQLSDLARMICQLKDRLFPGVSYAPVIDMVKELNAITSNSSEIGFTEVTAVVSVLEAAAEFTNKIAENTMLITSIFEVIDNLLAVNQETLIESQALSNSSSRMLAIVSNMAAIINITNASNHVVKNHAYFAVSIRENNFEGFGRETLSINLTDFSEPNVNSYNITLETEGNIVYSTGSVTLPSSNLNSSNINRITNAVFLTDSLFLRRKFDYFNVSSVVISTSILREFDAIKELDSPVNLSFQLNPAIKGSFPQCVFWDQSLNSGYGDWSSDNCDTSYDSVTQAIKCFCNHLTSFAVIQDVSPTEPSTVVNVYYLDSVSYIGIIITIICLIITVVFYLYNKDLRISNHCHMLLNLCFAFIGLYLSFVTSIHARNINSFCALSGFMLQFFFLVCLSLMSAEAIDLYLNIVINSSIKFFHLKVTLVSWIVPIFIVIFCFSPSYMNYINDSSNL
ncbi:PREDICTED: adhesion G-protein coupled receptor G2-like [Amphimedon queenslandica]|uniref:GPS domain-containing protein n=1 Tax=Amphimedon queenslandica TaxID=400682 RepID=A0AAN0JC82_AMPQE|nr:PREDICTED: adhesion G-protein coupled receptor G2-like [Amphimedon queenslandica]|eukprot:XP_019854609.1 PREDICTED: adhesion G-protein coupled receptor G2-like [Amphimedon queenslandica]